MRIRYDARNHGRWEGDVLLWGVMVQDFYTAHPDIHTRTVHIKLNVPCVVLRCNDGRIRTLPLQVSYGDDATVTEIYNEGLAPQVEIQAAHIPNI